MTDLPEDHDSDLIKKTLETNKTFKGGQEIEIAKVCQIFRIEKHTSLIKQIKSQKKQIRRLQIADAKSKKKLKQKTVLNTPGKVSKKTTPSSLPAAKLGPSNILLLANSEPEPNAEISIMFKEQLQIESAKLEKLNSEVKTTKADGTPQEGYERKQVEV